MLKKTLYAAEEESEKVQEHLEFWSKIRDVRLKDFILLDELGINLAMVRLYARALKGERARGKKNQKRGKNISVIAVLSVRKLLASVNIYRAVDGVILEGFIVQN